MISRENTQSSTGAGWSSASRSSPACPSSPEPIFTSAVPFAESSNRSRPVRQSLRPRLRLTCFILKLQALTGSNTPASWSLSRLLFIAEAQPHRRFRCPVSTLDCPAASLAICLADHQTCLAPGPRSTSPASAMARVHETLRTNLSGMSMRSMTRVTFPSIRIPRPRSFSTSKLPTRSTHPPFLIIELPVEQHRSFPPSRLSLDLVRIRIAIATTLYSSCFRSLS